MPPAREKTCPAWNLCRTRRAVVNTSRLIASLPSATRLVRFFQLEGFEPARRPKWYPTHSAVPRAAISASAVMKMSVLRRCRGKVTSQTHLSQHSGEAWNSIQWEEKWAVSTVIDFAIAQVNRTRGLNRRPFDHATSVAIPHGRWGIVHYGIMVPNLPDPFRFFDAIVILGTARAPIFGKRSLAAGDPDDSAWILTGSAATPNGFEQYSITDQCDLSDDGSHLRFGDQLAINRTISEITLSASRPGASVQLTLNPTPAVSHFVHIPGIYDHWSVLCQAEGTFTAGDNSLTRKTLCTYEYARAVNLPLPFLFFTYQILNVEEKTQVLMTEVLGPAGLPVHRGVYIRDVDGAATTHTRGYEHTVHEYCPDQLTTADGHKMRMPKRFGWRVAGDDGAELITIDGTSNDDFAYGLGTGYAGSYHYTGRFRDAPITGTGYIEWIDRR